MTPELEMLIRDMREDIRGIDARTRSIELKVSAADAVSEGASRRLGRLLSAFIGPIAAALAGAAGGHFWPTS